MLTDLRLNLQGFIKASLIKYDSSLRDFSEILIETPAETENGDLSTNVAMKLAKALKKNPMAIGEALVLILTKDVEASSLKGKIKKIEVKKPGFINFYLATNAFCDIVYEVFKKDGDYGRLALGQGEKVQIEFVSANPTGPLSVAHARQAAVGDALANIFTFAGYDVKKEFYLNDEGNQINILGRSIELRAREELGEKVEFPEDGYQGDYIRDMAKKFMESHKIKDSAALNKIKPETFRQFGVDDLLLVIKKELKDFGVIFDVWSHQSKIATTKNIETVLSLLKKKGVIYEKEGALWFQSTNFGDDKDRVVKKSDGSFTYLAPDIVYHKDKFERGFKKVFNIWGPDHHGYIPRIKASVAALGIAPDALEVLIVQLATIFRDGKPLSMSTRRGQYISLREVMDEVGVDAARYFFLMRHISAHLDFDLELAKKQTPENPVYYIQYAHARINSVLDVAKEAKLKPKQSDLKLLKEDEELGLMRKIGSFSHVIELCVLQRDPYALASYLLELATAFHKFYDKHRVVGEDKELSAERLSLIDAARIVLKNGLKLLGVSAPEKM